MATEELEAPSQEKSGQSRLSIAVPINASSSPEATAFLKAHQHKLQTGQWSRRVRWVETGKFHLVLRVLGPEKGTDTEALVAALRTGLANLKPFELGVDRPILYPRPSRAREVACLIRHTSDLKRLFRIAHAAADSLLPEEERGKAAAKPHKAHISFGRIRSGKARKAPNLIAESGECPVLVGQVDLIRTEQGPMGPVSTSLESISLG